MSCLKPSPMAGGGQDAKSEGKKYLEDWLLNHLESKENGWSSSSPPKIYSLYHRTFSFHLR